MPDKQARLLKQLAAQLQGMSERDIWTFFSRTVAFGEKYAAAYQLPGPIYLVLDNSVIQAFKHRHKLANRRLDALAYATFCNFVRDWSDRETHLAISPVAIYEHIGRRLPASEAEVDFFLADLQKILSDTGLRIAMLCFQSSVDLYTRLKEIAADEQELTKFITDIDKADWKIDLRAPYGVKIPLGLAWSALPENMPLRYFQSWYVRFVLASRIERHIIRQCQNGEVAPIDSGPVSDTLAKLNKIGRNGLSNGLGDIDLLQICDIAHQYKFRPGYVLSGQTLDDDLSKVLACRHVYHVYGCAEAGHSQFNEQVENMVNLMFSNPFAEEDERGKFILGKLADFAEALMDICNGALPKTSSA